MDLGLKGKTAVVSGSTAGIGLAVATAPASEGASVVVDGRTEARVAAAVRQIREKAKDAQVRGLAADLGMASGVETFLKHVPETDVLVNNLGIFEVKPFLEIPDADWLRLFEVPADGDRLCLQIDVSQPQLTDLRGPGGRVGTPTGSWRNSGRVSTCLFRTARPSPGPLRQLSLLGQSAV